MYVCIRMYVCIECMYVCIYVRTYVCVCVMPDPKNSFRAELIICGRRPPTSSNGTLRRLVIFIAKFRWPGPLLCVRVQNVVFTKCLSHFNFN